jgi:hypothetical protein
MGRQALSLAHGDGIVVVGGDHDAARIVDDSVKDGVGDGTFTDLLVPVADIMLG